MNADDRPRRLCLVVPCYNEAERLPRQAFLDFLGRTPDTSLLFVDDGSTDDTARVLQELAAAAGPAVRVLSLAGNVGKAEAVRCGILAAFEQRPAFVGFWDADLATPLAVVRDFLAVLDERPRVDIVIGSRVRLLGHDVRRRPVRHYAGRLFATAASLVLGLPVYDTQCGAKVFRASEAVRQAFASPFCSSWVFDVELLARYLDAVGRERAERSICELPLMTWNDIPGSKVRIWHGFRAAWDLVRIRSSVRRRRGTG